MRAQIFSFSVNGAREVTRMLTSRTTGNEWTTGNGGGLLKAPVRRATNGETNCDLAYANADIVVCNKIFDGRIDTLVTRKYRPSWLALKMQLSIISRDESGMKWYINLISRSRLMRSSSEIDNRIPISDVT